jgi:hypothetical protein
MADGKHVPEWLVIAVRRSSSKPVVDQASRVSGDVVNRSGGVDPVQDAELLVVLEDGRCGRVEELQAPSHRGWTVVVAPFASACDPLDDDVVRCVEEHGRGQAASRGLQQVRQGTGLFNRAGEAVEEEPLHLPDPFPHHRDDERVRDELPLSHVRGSVSTQIRASRAVLAR